MNLCSGQLRVRNKVVAVGLERYNEKQIGRVVVFFFFFLSGGIFNGKISWL